MGWKKWTLVVVGTSVAANILFAIFSEPDPERRLTNMCGGYFKMLERNGVATVTKDQRQEACAAGWEQIAETIPVEDQLAFTEYTFKMSKAGARTHALSMIGDAMEAQAFVGACAWAQAAVTNPAARGVFCEKAPGFGMY